MTAGMKRTLIVRTMAGFLAVWLVFAGVLSILLVRREQEKMLGSLKESARMAAQFVQGEQNGMHVMQAMTSTGVEAYLVNLCGSSPYLLDAAVFRKDEKIYAETKYSCRVMIEEADWSRRSPYVTFSPLDCLNEEEFSELIEINGEAYEKQSRQMLQREYLDTFASGWVRGDKLYPDRIVLARQKRGTVSMDAKSWDISQMEIVRDYHIDTQKMYQTEPGWIGSGRYIENVMVFYPITSENLKMRERWEFEEVMLLKQDAELRKEAEMQYRESDGGIIVLHEGVPKGRYFIYTQADGLDIVLIAEGNPARDSLLLLLVVWLCCLALVLAAGGLVCRGLCRVYDKQARLEQSRRDTANALAHDLKTPLALIRGYTENLRFGVKPEKTERYLEAIQRETDRMDGILGGMLELSRLETGALPLHREPLALGALAAEGVERYRAAAEVRGITITACGERELSADRALMERALDNLLANALRHTPDGGAVTVTVSAGGLAVENTGAPIPEDELSRLWEAYYKGDRARTDHAHNGLGLSIVRAIAERHGFAVCAENTGTGVKFTIAG